MKNCLKYLLFLLMIGSLPYPLLAQNTDNVEAIELFEEEVEDSGEIIEVEEFFQETTTEEYNYHENHKKSIPWTGDSTDPYLKEKLDRQEGATQTWEKNRKKLSYNQEKKKTKKKKLNEKDTLNKFTGEGLDKILQWVLIVIGIIVILGLIIYLAQGGSFRQGQKIGVDISDEKLDWIEENLPEADVLSPLEAAIASHQHRKAIRLYFLLIVQKMTLAGEINWQKEKTNRAYILETYNKVFHDNFRSCVRIYERVWYGERSVNEEEFNKIEPIFKDLVNHFIIQTPSHAE